MLPDGQPLFGASKTIRGLVLAIPLTAAIAVLIGFDWMTGAGLAAASMGGDLLSSFVKRRLRLPLHGQAFGLDQIPEALLPMLLFQASLKLTAVEIAVVLAAFIILESVAVTAVVQAAHPRSAVLTDGAAARRSRCRVISGGQLRRTSTMQDPAPAEV